MNDLLMITVLIIYSVGFVLLFLCVLLKLISSNRLQMWSLVSTGVACSLWPLVVLTNFLCAQYDRAVGFSKFRWSKDKPYGVKFENRRRRILGINFFTGTVFDAVEQMITSGGLLIAPAAPTLLGLQTNLGYREAAVEADLAIADSSYMVLVWNVLFFDSVPRISGLLYLRTLLARSEVSGSNTTFWVMASLGSCARNVKWLSAQQINPSAEMLYIAPMYGDEINDTELLERIQSIRPQNIIITLGGLKQEPLGLFLKKNLNYAPAIHCIGAAIAFLSGDQVAIPQWADRAYIGWALRIFSNPSVYGHRYLKALNLPLLLLRYRSELPPLLFNFPNRNGI